ncbi:mitochondrial carrier domain-containing protein [Lentinula raphanica]|nr:mitochondrial carrier domain-containing protein [Lentinula raphanica]
MTSTLPPLIQAISGAIGSASANTLTYPLDLVTTRVQLASPTENTRLQTDTQRFEQDKGKQKQQEVEGPLRPDLSSEVKDANRFIHLKAIRILRSIVNTDGVGALYDGLLTDTASTLISNFFYFYIYSFLRKLLIKRLTRSQSSTVFIGKTSPNPLSSVKLAIWQDLVLGFLSGVASRAVSMPLSMITLRLQTGRHEPEEDPSGNLNSNRNVILRAFKSIYEEQGLRGFWRGFNTTILLSLNPSITLAFFQLFRRVLALSRRTPSSAGPVVLVDPTPSQAFFGGALSNSIAVALLYPLILSKTRLQAFHRSPNSVSANRPHSASSTPTLRTILIDAYKGRYRADREPMTDDRIIAGFNGLYQGLEMQILKGFLNQGVMFLVKGRIEQLIIQAYLHHRMGRLSTPSNLLKLTLVPVYSDDPHRSLEAWNIVEHVGRRYL